MSPIFWLATLSVLLVSSVQSAPQFDIEQSLPLNTTAPSLPTACPPNSTLANGYHSDRSCQLDCLNRNNEHHVCIALLIVGPYCTCNEGYIFRNESSNLCIKVEDC